MLRAAFPPPGQLPGTGTNDLASAGNVGEVISALLASGSALALTTATPLTLTSITLSPGDWDVRYEVDFVPAATTSITQLVAAASGTTNTLPAGQDASVQQSFAAQVPGANNIQLFGIKMQPQRVAVATTGPQFLVAQATFTVAGLSAFGTIVARRVR